MVGVPWRKSSSASPPGAAAKDAAGSSASKAKPPPKRASSVTPKTVQQPAGAGLTIGERVTIGGLNGAVELNGRVAVVFGFDCEAGRYVVELEEGAMQKRVKRENLTPKGNATGAVAAKARMFAAAAAAACGKGSPKPQTPVKAQTPAKAQTPVKASPPSGTSGSTSTPPKMPGERRLSSGTKVSIGGLTGAPELNGKAGTIRSFDDTTGRYVIELNDGEKKSLKPNNVSQLSDSSMAARDRKFKDLDTELQGFMQDEMDEAPIPRGRLKKSDKGIEESWN